MDKSPSVLQIQAESNNRVIEAADLKKSFVNFLGIKIKI